jgi:hypothetical protein
LIWDLGPSPFGDKYTTERDVAVNATLHDLALVRCKSCELLQLRTTPEVEEIYDDYLYLSSVTKSLSHVNKLLASRIKQDVLDSEDALVLDIGCNEGILLKSLKDDGFNVLGVEPSKIAAMEAETKGIEIINGYFTRDIVQNIKKRGTPTAIVLSYVLANIPRLFEVFELLSELSDSQTKIYIMSGYHPSQFQINMFEYIDHDHLTYLTISDLDTLGKRHGFQVEDAWTVEQKGGSVICVLGRIKNGGARNGELEQLLQREKWLKIMEDKTIAELQNSVRDRVRIFRQLIQEYSKKGFKILGVGASISTTMFLMRFLEKNNYPNLEFFDDDFSKTGKFMPYFGWKVRHMSDLIQESEDVDCLAIVFAWQHESRILDRLRKIGYTGLVMVPSPTIRVFSINI